MHTQLNLYNKASENAYIEVIYTKQIHKQQQHTLRNRETWSFHKIKTIFKQKLCKQNNHQSICPKQKMDTNLPIVIVNGKTNERKRKKDRYQLPFYNSREKNLFIKKYYHIH